MIEKSGNKRSLLIKNVSIEDVAEYTCVAENIRTTTDLELVGGSSQIVIKNEEVSYEQVAIKGQDITFNIPFEQCPKKPQVQWFYQGTQIETSEKVKKIILCWFYLIKLYIKDCDQCKFKTHVHYD